VQLHVTVIAPETFSYQIKHGGTVRKDGTDQPTSYIELQTPNPKRRAQFLMVLSPALKGVTPPPVREIRGDHVLGVRVERDGGTDLVLFNYDGGPMEAEGLTTDGDQAYIRDEGGEVTGFAMHNGTTIAYCGKTLYASKVRTTVAIRPGEEIAQVTPEATETPVQDPVTRIREVIESIIETIFRFFGIRSLYPIQVP
jgi:hypothetical protein